MFLISHYVEFPKESAQLPSYYKFRFILVLLTNKDLLIQTLINVAEYSFQRNYWDRIIVSIESFQNNEWLD